MSEADTPGRAHAITVTPDELSRGELGPQSFRVAAVLPVVERTAGIVESALDAAGIDAPLLVLRGDGGAMSTESFRRRPSFTVGSGPGCSSPAGRNRGNRARVRRDELKRIGGQARAPRPAFTASHGSPDLDPVG